MLERSTHIHSIELDTSLKEINKDIFNALNDLSDILHKNQNAQQATQKIIEPLYFIYNLRNFYTAIIEAEATVKIMQAAQSLQKAMPAHMIANTALTSSVFFTFAAFATFFHCAKEYSDAVMKQKSAIFFLEKKLIEHSTVSLKVENERRKVAKLKNKHFLNAPISEIELSVNLISTYFHDASWSKDMKVTAYADSIRRKISDASGDENNSLYSPEAKEIAKKIKQFSNHERDLFYAMLREKQARERVQLIEDDLRVHLLINHSDKNKNIVTEMFEKHAALHKENSAIPDLSRIATLSSNEVAKLRTPLIEARQQTLNAEAELTLNNKKSEFYFSQVNLLGAACMLAGVAIMGIAPAPSAILICAAISINLLLTAHSMYHGKAVIPSIYNVMKQTNKKFMALTAHSNISKNHSNVEHTSRLEFIYNFSNKLSSAIKDLHKDAAETRSMSTFSPETKSIYKSLFTKRNDSADNIRLLNADIINGYLDENRIPAIAKRLEAMIEVCQSRGKDETSNDIKILRKLKDEVDHFLASSNTQQLSI